METQPPSESSSDEKSRVPSETPDQVRERTEFLRSLTLEERASMIVSACRAARKIENARARAGLPPTTPASWPASTWEFLKKHAQEARRRSSSAEG